MSSGVGEHALWWARCDEKRRSSKLLQRPQSHRCGFVISLLPKPICLRSTSSRCCHLGTCAVRSLLDDRHVTIWLKGPEHEATGFIRECLLRDWNDFPSFFRSECGSIAELRHRVASTARGLDLCVCMHSWVAWKSSSGLLSCPGHTYCLPATFNLKFTCVIPDAFSSQINRKYKK